MTLLMGKTAPLPWSIHGGDWVRDAKDRTVVVVTSRGSDDAANAVLIVRAVNAHEALVAMVEALIGALRDEDDSFDVKYDARKLLDSLE